MIYKFKILLVIMLIYKNSIYMINDIYHHRFFDSIIVVNVWIILLLWIRFMLILKIFIDILNQPMFQRLDFNRLFSKNIN